MPHTGHAAPTHASHSTHHGHHNEHVDAAAVIDEVFSRLGEVAIEEEMKPNGKERFVLGDRNPDDDEDDDYVWEDRPIVKTFDGDLRRQYLAYISKINSSQCGPGDLSEFVNHGVIHNDSAPMSVDEYAKIISDSKRDLPGLDFAVEMLVMEKAQTTPVTIAGTKTTSKDTREGDGSIAARLKLTYKPTSTTQDTFYEHVFYAFEKGKISKVWSLLDGAGLKWKEKRDEETRKKG
ncbi:uncharacterized protein Z519_04872 [Cladophialophora bantiana CBS 173.52]|uniref:SnoaL-like domain-containing protein n=1 Tax=Cladophialophora bantiana (strain ATCC 10958 / CBS 173.52 / CDC B-1940 / NIH 8579) TaxID=1442370 RepID=A0A0D2IDP7_CLAB1|nr:uncharacterized protein Z519_04872 [Cladophialophora bantiana CBS 173.52]KIW94894.1 hypothetical protein Z519_04872 [Cladophialophora bantiana CBS 173.52]